MCQSKTNLNPLPRAAHLFPAQGILPALCIAEYRKRHNNIENKIALTKEATPEEITEELGFCKKSFFETNSKTTRLLG